MARLLRWAGAAALAGCVWALLAAELGWLPRSSATALFRPLGLGGVALLAAGTALGFGGALFGALRRGRCARCGARTERGQTYCNDHLRQTVQEYQDRLTRR